MLDQWEDVTSFCTQLMLCSLYRKKHTFQKVGGWLRHRNKTKESVRSRFWEIQLLPYSNGQNLILSNIFGTWRSWEKLLIPAFLKIQVQLIKFSTQLQWAYIPHSEHKESLILLHIELQRFRSDSQLEKAKLFITKRVCERGCSEGGVHLWKWGFE